MEISLGFAIAFLALVLSIGTLSIRAERELRTLKKRCRYLSDRLEVVERFNGLAQTDTSIHVNK